MIYQFVINSDMKNNLLIAILATAVIVGGWSFTIGMKYGQSSSSSLASQGNQRFGQNGAGGTGGSRNRFQGGGVVSGKILSIDSTGITLETRGGAGGETSGSKIVILSSSTQVTKAAQGD